MRLKIKIPERERKRERKLEDSPCVLAQTTEFHGFLDEANRNRNSREIRSVSKSIQYTDYKFYCKGTRGSWK